MAQLTSIAMNISNNRIINGCIIFYVFHVISKERRQLVLTRTACYRSIPEHKNGEMCAPVRVIIIQNILVSCVCLKEIKYTIV
jgi:hypothetical protein